MQLSDVRPGRFAFVIRKVYSGSKLMYADISSEERGKLGLFAKDFGTVEIPKDMHLRPDDKITIKIEIKKGA